MFSILGKSLADRGYYINLDSSLDRRENVERQIEKYSIDGLERFPALTADLLAASCTKSHLAAFKQADEDGIETLFVAEDDFDIRDPVFFPCTENSIAFNDYLYAVKDQLDTVNWDVFLLGYAPKCQLIPISHTDNLCRVPSSTGGWAYLIKRKAYNFILKHSHYMSDRIAIDDWLPLLGNHGFDVLGSYPFLIHHAVGYVSTLQPKGQVDYNQMIDGYMYKYYDWEDKPSLSETLTVVVTASVCKDYLARIDCMLSSLPKTVKYCKFLFVYDPNGVDGWKVEREAGTFLRYNYEGLNREILVLPDWKNRVSSVRVALEKVRTPYFLWLDHNWSILNAEELETTLRQVVLSKDIEACTLPVFDSEKFKTMPISDNYEEIIKNSCIALSEPSKMPKIDRNWQPYTSL